MFFLLFPVLGFWWWILTLSFLGWLVLCEEFDMPLGGLFVLFGYLLVVSLLGDSWIFLKWLTHGGLIYFLVGVPIYLIIGFFWGVFRYWWEQSLSVAKYNERKLEFLQTRCGIRAATIFMDVPDEHLDQWMKVIGVTKSYPNIEFQKLFPEQKKRIVNWMSWWWLSMASFFLKDFLLRFYAILLNKTQVIFENIDRRVWGRVEGEYTRMETRLAEHNQQLCEEYNQQHHR